jgi:hypothetical protein
MLASRFREREHGMKTVWIAGIALAAATTGAHAQSTIYKHVDESGHITYSNKPMKGATVIDLEPITVIPGTPGGALQAQPQRVVALEKAPAAAEKSDLRPVAAIVTPLPRTTLAAIEPQVQRKRDEERRRILEDELRQEESSLGTVRSSLLQEQQNPELATAVRALQQAQDASPAQLLSLRENLDRASGKIRGLQSTASEHEKNIEALKKELGALKP